MQVLRDEALRFHDRGGLIRGLNEDEMTLHETALRAVHDRDGATVVPYAGWAMPLRYSSDLAEHRAVRASAGLFDLSHMAQLEVSGPDASAALDHALVGVYGAMMVGKAKYSMITTSDGGIVDDLIVYRIASEEYLVIANASNRERVRDEIVERSAHLAVQVIDHTHSRAMIAIQGPRAAEILSGLTPAELDTIRYYAITSTSVAGIPALLARTGYTGEDGFEVIVPAESAVALWDALRAAGDAAGLVPCGLAARDTLRLEAGMPLYGNELSEAVTPYAANLGRVVNLDHEFVGRDALAAATEPARGLVSLVGEGRRAARAGSVVRVDGTEIGIITSGVLSPSLGHPIALALVDSAYTAHGTVLSADVRGHELPMTIVPGPFYRRS